MAPREPSQEALDKEYTCCKGFLIYGGLQRSVGQEPRCLGVRQPLPNVIVTEEDAVPPPPEDSRFIFVGVGVSVYNRDMLQRNRLPLVNGFSQLITSQDVAPEEEKASSVARRPRQQQRPAVDTAGAAAADRAGAAVPTSQATHTGGGGDEALATGGGEQKGGAQDWEKVKREDVRDQIKAVVDYGRTRVQKQFDVSVELARMAPGKLRNAANVQVAKAQEMPGILLSTNKRMIETGSKYVRDFLAEQEKKK